MGKGRQRFEMSLGEGHLEEPGGRQSSGQQDQGLQASCSFCFQIYSPEPKPLCFPPPYPPLPSLSPSILSCIPGN